MSEQPQLNNNRRSTFCGTYHPATGLPSNRRISLPVITLNSGSAANHCNFSKEKKDKKSPRSKRGQSAPPAMEALPEDILMIQEERMFKEVHLERFSPHDQSVLTEIHGILSDMIHDPLNSHSRSGLRAMKSLLCILGTRDNEDIYEATPANSEPTVDIKEEDEIECPYTGEKPSIQKLRRNMPSSILRRMSSSTWTTTTSATGMPSLEPEPTRRRSTSFCYPLKTSPVEQSSPDPGNDPGPSTSTGVRKKRSPKKEQLTYLYVGECDDEGDESEPDQQSWTGGYAIVCINCGKVNKFTRLKIQPVIQEKDKVKVYHPEPEKYVNRNHVYDLEATRNDDLLQRLEEWDFPIFDFSVRYPETCLSRMAYKIFLDTGLIYTFKIPLRRFFAFFHHLEMGYHNNSYHNRMHAADVLHGVYYIVTQGIRKRKRSQSPKAVLPAGSPKANKEAVPQNKHIPHEDGQIFSSLELLSLFTAAAMHDFDHPGRTNAFLCATFDPLAVLYNDRSVLENHHAAASWGLLMSCVDYNFLANLDKSEFKRLRFQTVDLILATDLKRHFEILGEFTGRVSETPGGPDFEDENDRLLLAEVVIKLSDINGPCKQIELHLEWTKRIAEEFYAQGDEEKSLQLPVSPYMDRNNPHLAQLQATFFSHLVQPTLRAFGELGFFPGTWVPVDFARIEQEVEDEEQRGEFITGGDDLDEIDPNKELCSQSLNLANNYKYWMRFRRQQQRENPALKLVPEADQRKEYEAALRKYEAAHAVKRHLNASFFTDDPDDYDENGKRKIVTDDEIDFLPPEEESSENNEDKPGPSSAPQGDAVDERKKKDGKGASKS